ncbi:MAG TPA: PAS domain S-box protein [Pedobacter sp.]
MDFQCIVIETRQEFLKALEEFLPDIILSDHSLPSFNSHEALEIIRETGKRTPFILITGTISEEFAVDVLKKGADDYILKDRLERLPNAIENALKKYQLETERQNHLFELTKNERYYRALIENGSDALVILDVEGNPTYASPSIQRVLGYTPTDCTGLKLNDILHADDTSLVNQYLFDCLQKPGIPIENNIARVKHKNGNWIWLEATFTNMLHDPIINGIVNNFKDITDRILAERVIKESEEKYRSFYENSMDGILLTIPNGEILAANPAACKIFQMTEEEICKTGRTGLIDNSEPGLARVIKEKHSKDEGKTEITFIRKDGSKFPGELTSAIFNDAAGHERSSVIVRDISERKIAEELILQSELQYRSLIQDLPVAVYTTDLDGKIQLYNKAAATLWGREPEIGKDQWCGSWKIYNSEAIAMALDTCPMAITLKTGNPVVGDQIIVEQPCGKRRIIAPHPFPVYDLDGRMQGAINMLVDITDRNRAEEKLTIQQQSLIKVNELLTKKNKSIILAKRELTKRAVQLEESSRYKSEFLANMSHELRTPLNSILILAGLLQENNTLNLAPKQLQYADVIHKSGSDLLSLINDILDLAKIEAGKVDLYYTNTDVSDLVTDMQQLFTSLSEQKKIRFNITVSPRFPKNIWTDKQRLEQALKNLLSNAFKFTSEGGEVHIHLAKMDKQISITVKDTGIGIQEDKKQQIFEAFQQADGSTTREYGGTGLGLSITKELIHKLGGDISVESTFGKGSTFVITLPLHIQKKYSEADAPDVLPVTDSKIPFIRVNNGLFGKKVLLVDDDMRNVFALGHLLEEHGMKVYTAGNGEEALQIVIENNDVEIVLMDIMMPEMDGYETIRQIRLKKIYEHLPIIALTAKAMVGDEEKCMKAGASDYISKPFVNKHLLSRIEYWVDEPVKTAV